MKKFSPLRIGLAVVAPLAAALFSILISSLAVLASKKSPIEAYKTMWEFGSQPANLMETLNIATPFYIAALAVAVTFRAGLFNIGVEGQLRLGALFAAYFGAMFSLPPILHILAIFLIAMSVGGLWAAIAGYLKVKRGVSEVISTIMLNALAGGLSAYLLATHFTVKTDGLNSNNLYTKEISESGRIPNLMPFLNKLGIKDQPGSGVFGMLLVAVALGITFWFVVNRTRFGFELRATGINPIAARVSGVNSKKMTIIAMAASGAIASLAGLTNILGDTYQFTMGFRTGIGFTAIAVALLGRNSAGGMAISALLFAFLEVSSRALELIDIAPETYVIMQGSILLSAVIAYEVVRRYKITVQSNEFAKAVHQ